MDVRSRIKREARRHALGDLTIPVWRFRCGPAPLVADAAVRTFIRDWSEEVRLKTGYDIDPEIIAKIAGYSLDSKENPESIKEQESCLSVNSLESSPSPSWPFWLVEQLQGLPSPVWLGIRNP